ncbi:DUF2635 domain-containing protein [Klebsiella quasipneumoniae]|uniref:DUF2635 domain-containing protein n=1 Tax=Klebsiella quasipneumoniae TaxID=1463165 RepID=UPI0029D98BF1|nr:DUF2635 domain-containing protein [Klebsiella quasipneumoniae]MDX7658464.1 DUF2635 domain-containing protein [Klebsiella quasipneumoniae]
MKVKAREGIRVPREDNARRYIEQELVEVPESTYYLRRLNEGDLVKVTDATVDVTAAAAMTGKGTK